MGCGGSCGGSCGGGGSCGCGGSCGGGATTLERADWGLNGELRMSNPGLGAANRIEMKMEKREPTSQASRGRSVLGLASPAGLTISGGELPMAESSSSSIPISPPGTAQAMAAPPAPPLPLDGAPCCCRWSESDDPRPEPPPTPTDPGGPTTPSGRTPATPGQPPTPTQPGPGTGTPSAPGPRRPGGGSVSAGPTTHNQRYRCDDPDGLGRRCIADPSAIMTGPQCRAVCADGGYIGDSRSAAYAPAGGPGPGLAFSSDGSGDSGGERECLEWGVIRGGKCSCGPERQCGPSITKWLYLELWSVYLRHSERDPVTFRRETYLRRRTLRHRELSSDYGIYDWKRHRLGDAVLRGVSKCDDSSCKATPADTAAKLDICGICLDNTAPGNINLFFSGRVFQRSYEAIARDARVFNQYINGLEDTQPWDVEAGRAGNCIANALGRLHDDFDLPHEVFLGIDTMCGCVRRHLAHRDRNCASCPAELDNPRARSIIDRGRSRLV